MQYSLNNTTLYYSCDSLQSIDREAVENYGMQSIVLMENAARGAAEILTKHTNRPQLRDVVIVCGSGNNGGDGYAMARHLVNQGCAVRIVQIVEPKTQDAITNASIASKMDIEILKWSTDAIDGASLLVDAIFGTGLHRIVEGVYADAINAMNEHEASCIAVDIPSGLHCDTGKPLGCCVEAGLTITFVGLKLGFMQGSAGHYTGEVLVTGIGCPEELVQMYGVTSAEYDM